MELLIDGRSARLFGSQGQQRSVVLSLKLGECELVEQTVGESPILLLDDVMSELDRARQQYVRSSFGNRQVLITSCGRARFSKKAAAFLVSGGTVTRLEAPRKTRPLHRSLKKEEIRPCIFTWEKTFWFAPKDVIGIFDLETTTTGELTRAYLKNAERQSQVTNVSPELPKSFILTRENGVEAHLYFRHRPLHAAKASGRRGICHG